MVVGYGAFWYLVHLQLRGRVPFMGVHGRQAGGPPGTAAGAHPCSCCWARIMNTAPCWVPPHHHALSSTMPPPTRVAPEAYVIQLLLSGARKVTAREGLLNSALTSAPAACTAGRRTQRGSGEPQGRASQYQTLLGALAGDARQGPGRAGHRQDVAGGGAQFKSHLHQSWPWLCSGPHSAHTRRATFHSIVCPWSAAAAGPGRLHQGGGQEGWAGAGQRRRVG